MTYCSVHWQTYSLWFLASGRGYEMVALHRVDFPNGEPRLGTVERARWQRVADLWVARGEVPEGAQRLLHGAVPA